MEHTALIQKPITSEKATDLKELGQYVFLVKSSATKNEIKKAVKAMYKVDVQSVHIINSPAKVKRFRGLAVKQGGRKKAVVTLKEGQKIDLAT